MKIPDPNPKVYRLAADLIDCSMQEYSCNAIDDACERLGCTRLSTSLHMVQYELMFGRYDWAVCLFLTREFFCHGGTRRRDHPYWDRPPNAERQRMRILALLFMADICEARAS